MNDTHWSIALIAARGERRMISFIQLDKATSGEVDGYSAKRAFSSKAEGVFEGWCAIFGGKRRNDDTSRLRALLDSIQPHNE